MGIWGKNGAQGQNRTADTAIFSRMLYQLSYLGIPAGWHGRWRYRAVQRSLSTPFSTPTMLSGSTGGLGDGYRVPGPPVDPESIVGVENGVDSDR